MLNIISHFSATQIKTTMNYYYTLTGMIAKIKNTANTTC